MVTVAQLKKEARDLGIKGFSKMKKDELLEAIGPERKPATRKDLGRRAFRPSPDQPAKNFDLGETEMGNNGLVYEVVEDARGVKRWKKLDIPKAKKAPKKAPAKSPAKKVKGFEPIKNAPAKSFPPGFTMEGDDGKEYEVVLNDDGVNAWQRKGSKKPLPASPEKKVKGKKPPKQNFDRPSPSESATLFSEGYTMEGNDGNDYEVVENKNGVKRWKKKAQKKTKKVKEPLRMDKEETKVGNVQPVKNACVLDFEKKLKKKIIPGEYLGSGQFGSVYRLCTGEGCGKYVVKESVLESEGLDLQFKTEVKCLLGLKNVKAEYNGKKWKCVPTIYGHGYCEKDGEKIGYIILEPMKEPDYRSTGFTWEIWYAYMATLKAGYCHLDSHSGNIMSDMDGNAVIIDWGYGWTMKWGKPIPTKYYPAQDWPGFKNTWAELVWSQWNNMSWVAHRLDMRTEGRTDWRDLREQFMKVSKAGPDPYD